MCYVTILGTLGKVCQSCEAKRGRGVRVKILSGSGTVLYSNRPWPGFVISCTVGASTWR